MKWMETNARIRQADLSSLVVIRYPDPRLREVCAAVDEPSAPEVRALVERMTELLFTSRGVGLAAPQVAVAARMFIASPTFQRDDLGVYVNPEIVHVDGQQDGEEGCLSFPGITCKVRRYNVVTVRATGLDGRPFEETAEGLTARIFQHEIDHLSGTLLADRMGSVAKLANRRALKDLEDQFVAACGSGDFP